MRHIDLIGVVKEHQLIFNINLKRNETISSMIIEDLSEPFLDYKNFTLFDITDEPKKLYSMDKYMVDIIAEYNFTDRKRYAYNQLCQSGKNSMIVSSKWTSISPESMSKLSDSINFNNNYPKFQPRDNYELDGHIRYINELKQKYPNYNMVSDGDIPKDDSNYLFKLWSTNIKKLQAIFTFDKNISNKYKLWICIVSIEWSPTNHIYFPIIFRNEVMLLYQCLKRKQLSLGLKISKFIIYEIVKFMY